MVLRVNKKTVAVSGRFLLFGGEINGSGCCLAGRSARCIPVGTQKASRAWGTFPGHIQIANADRDCLSAPKRLGQNGASAATVLPIFLRSLASSVVGFSVQSRTCALFAIGWGFEPRKGRSYGFSSMLSGYFRQHCVGL